MVLRCGKAEQREAFVVVVKLRYDDANRLSKALERQSNEHPPVASDGDILALKSALKKGGSVHDRDQNDETLLSVAASSPHANVELLRFLVEQGSDVNA